MQDDEIRRMEVKTEDLISEVSRVLSLIRVSGQSNVRIAGSALRLQAVQVGGTMLNLSSLHVFHSSPCRHSQRFRGGRQACREEMADIFDPWKSSVSKRYVTDVQLCKVDGRSQPARRVATGWRAHQTKQE